MRTTTASLVTAAVGMTSLAFPISGLATGSHMPWEGPPQQIVDSPTGPVAQALGVLAIVALGFAFAFSEGGGIPRASPDLVDDHGC